LRVVSACSMLKIYFLNRKKLKKSTLPVKEKQRKSLILQRQHPNS
jgi:hypothetical protein